MAAAVALPKPCSCMEYPWLRGVQTAAKAQKFACRAHAVHNQRFAERFAQRNVPLHHFYLDGEWCTSELVEACFANHHYLRVNGELLE